jgi:hypothetical protein
MSAGLTISLRRAAKGSSRFNVAARNFAGVAGAPLAPPASATKRKRFQWIVKLRAVRAGPPGKGKGGRQATIAPDRRRLGRRRTVDQNPPGPGVVSAPVRAARRPAALRANSCVALPRLRSPRATIAITALTASGRRHLRCCPDDFVLEFAGFKRMAWSPLPGGSPALFSTQRRPHCMGRTAP